MHKKYLYLLLVLLIPAAITLAIDIVPGFTRKADIHPPQTLDSSAEAGSGFIKPCNNLHPEWRKAQTIDGVEISESPVCNPDNPYNIAAFVKGMNNISMRTLMNTRLSEDSLIKGDDLDNDGDPDIIHIKLEVIELNGSTPDRETLAATYDIAPGIQPGLWIFAPKSRGMSVKNFLAKEANALLRAPTPTIRVEQGDQVFITLENTHYFPHTIHFHGVDHPFLTSTGGDNDGVSITGDAPVFPGGSRTYEIKPRKAGTMFYHCHVQTDKHLLMGLNSMFIVEENRPNNWVQTFNIGAGKVRHPSAAVKESYSQEYDLLYQSVDKNLAETIQLYNDPRLIAREMNRVYNMTESSENYFLLNGHSFPFTLRDSLIVTEPNENIKLRVANGQHTMFALHIHGHKAAITAYDGVSRPPEQQITRDVYELAPAQRLDLHLQTVNDGLHSYGPGIWLYHDHVETGITSDGMSPGGNIAVLVFKEYLDDEGMPKIRDEALNKLFNTNYYAKKLPVWGLGKYMQLFGQAGVFSQDYPKLIGAGLLFGIAIWLTVFVYRGLRHEG